MPVNIDKVVKLDHQLVQVHILTYMDHGRERYLCFNVGGDLICDGSCCDVSPARLEEMYWKMDKVHRKMFLEMMLQEFEKNSSRRAK